MWTCGRRAAQRQLRTLAVFRMSEAVSAGLGPTLVSPPVDLRPAIGLFLLWICFFTVPILMDVARKETQEKQQVLDRISKLEQRMKQLESRK
jgi:hypothetical protein